MFFEDSKTNNDDIFSEYNNHQLNDSNFSSIFFNNIQNNIDKNDLNSNNSYNNFIDNNINNDNNKNIKYNNNDNNNLIKNKIKEQKFLLYKHKPFNIKIENKKKSLNDIIKYKENLKLRNRLSSQKSRDKKKLELQILIQENLKLKNELNDFNNKINLLCSNCKCIINKNYNNENNDNFKIEEINLIESNNNSTNYNQTIYSSFNNLFEIKKIFFSILAIITLLAIFTFSINEINNNNNKIIRKLNNNNLNIKKQKNIFINNDNKKIYNKSLNYSYVKSLPQIYIEDFNYNNSYYIDFSDYYNKIKKSNENICQKDIIINNFLNKKNDNNKKKVKNNLKENNKNNQNKNFYNSVYFKLFVPLCNIKEPENISTHYDYFFLEDINEKKNNSYKKDNNLDNKNYYYEVKCEVMDINKLILET